MLQTLRVQAYLSATWSCYDQLTDVGSRLWFPSRSNNARRSFPDRFLIDGSRSTDNCDRGFAIHTRLHRCWGWPIGLSYNLRNVFLHEAGIVSGSIFFNRESLFNLNHATWTLFLKKVENKGFKPDWIHSSTTIPTPDEADFLGILERLETECDAALGVFIQTSFYAYQSQLDAFDQWIKG